MDDELVTGELAVDGLMRSVAVRPPREQNAPLVVVLHGNFSGSARTYARPIMYDWTSFAAHADEWGIAVAYPQGHGGCWADGRGVTTADESGVDDVSFLCAVIDWCGDRFGTVPDRTLVAGISNGAFMSHRFALEAADRVPVLAAVAGGFPAALLDIRPTHAVSAMLINGDADPIQPITGGYSRRSSANDESRGHTLGLSETARHWQGLDRCADDGGTITTENSSRHTVTGGVGGTQVSAWTVFEGGHTWPGTPVPAEWADTPGSAVTLEFDAAEQIWSFAHPLLIPASTRKL
ncbi:alpha/beta hydrolase family esterase [Nocardia sp. NPDC050630]|uniref:alpha/beta hydrolase family esterase n=1 Tax=Nocardia sp. NPDC050630 TaxID=3364321 RepID=UPI0037A8F2B8